MSSRPWKLGDCAVLVWGRKEYGYGVIIQFYNELEGFPDLYAKVQFRNGSFRIWPVKQLKPAGHTIFCFRHLVFTIIEALGQPKPRYLKSQPRAGFKPEGIKLVPPPDAS